MSSPPESERASDPPEWSRDPFCPRVGRFLVGPELGRGGMGRVHEAALAELDRAPSDAALLGRALEELGQEATRESSEGHVSPAVFHRGDALFARAMQIQPGDPKLADQLAGLRLREAIYDAAHGKDGRPLLEGALRLVESTTPRNQWKDTGLANVAWTLGSVQRLWGEDPQSAQAEAHACAAPA